MEKLNSNPQRVNIEEVDELLRENSALNASLGNDSTEDEVAKVKWHLIRNINKIKDLCLYTFNIVAVDDNHRK